MTHSTTVMPIPMPHRITQKSKMPGQALTLERIEKAGREIGVRRRGAAKEKE